MMTNERSILILSNGSNRKQDRENSGAKVIDGDLNAQLALGENFQRTVVLIEYVRLGDLGSRRDHIGLRH